MSTSLRARAGLEKGIEMLRRLNPSEWSTATVSADGSLLRRNIDKRHMRGGAVAGTVVGVILGVALLAFCLYPFVVYLIKRRRGTANAPFDPEAAIAQKSDEVPDGPTGQRQRVSSSDSLQQQNGDPTHGQHGDSRSKEELDWATPRGVYDQDVMSFDGNDGWVSDQAGHYRVQAAPFPQLGCYDGEFAPPVAEDDQPGVLKGTSADYYSTSIPSEAFGMIPSAESTLDSPPTRTSSRGSSFRHNVIAMFRRKSGRDQTMDSISPPIAEEPLPLSAVPHLQGTPIKPIITNGAHVESPINISPTSSNLPPLPAPQADFSAPSPPSDAEGAKTPPESPLVFRQFKAVPSPPVIPAPGTVNPMDIMPASTESEHWYRTEHQLYSSSYELSPDKPCMPEPLNDSMMLSPSPTPPEDEMEQMEQMEQMDQMDQMDQMQPTFTIQSPTATTSTDLAPQQEFTTFEEVLTPRYTPEPNGHASVSPDGRNGSYTSQQSTPFLGHGFTDASSHNTPSTQLDTPSPESMVSSDFRQSTSPQSVLGAPSPRTGVYRCDEPGCAQVFDQPHKLKHHQRYHSKDHKCVYPGCGKGFGTKTHLQRHINDRHEKKKKFHCSVPGCDYSRTGGKAFPRKDNWKRHMMKIHNIDQQQLPEPIEIDLDMVGA
ncbi:Zinc finger protein ZXDC [Cladobotryum mycophilum]|uniref:Zinc finger protein ZXDC n=1 Tax=Cladobotryum mycophilum TaxID=491253 RepID=A0ABR0T313_9HYPO